ncbi:hypothetical protein HPL003_12360 [Paenibacillus terrae HPL-003]|uniref:Uncharacterized protein n=1 Tax=Paenibacillus terrae (strain HPL-003) TaxID=985665 RepID=G7W247_PAETH|nr:hypothetical protein HPL003_12360 [Paenibacillus terrae HPL-003]
MVNTLRQEGESVNKNEYIIHPPVITAAYTIGHIKPKKADRMFAKFAKPAALFPCFRVSLNH